MKKAIISGLALFSMFFGAGNAMFPFMLGEFAGASVSYAILGFLLAGVAASFLGLFAISLYGGDWRAFFGRIGKKPGFWLFSFLMLILGPFGSIPRLITVAYGTMEPYLLGMSLPLFSVLACGLAFLFAFRKSQVVKILGLILTPILLVSLGIIVVGGLWNAPPLPTTGPSALRSFGEGIHWGYSLMDMLAAFLYGAMILKEFKRDGEKGAMSKMAGASLLSGALLCVSYTGLALVGAHYAPEVASGAPEQIVRAYSTHFLGSWGGVVASVTVGLACLTTVISLATVCTTFFHEDLLKSRGGRLWPMTGVLGVSFAMSILGFGGIAKIVGPLLDLLHPGLIALCCVNIAAKSRLRLLFQVR